MDEGAARQVIAWEYPEPYTFYNLYGSEACLEELTAGAYYSAEDNSGTLVGFYCFGAAAQVGAGGQAGLYADEALLDIGLGMKPEFCGKGRGLEFLQAGMDWARQCLGAKAFRLTVAAFNGRAIAVYERAGYQKAALFTSAARSGGIDFWVMAQ